MPRADARGAGREPGRGAARARGREPLLEPGHLFRFQSGMKVLRTHVALLGDAHTGKSALAALLEGGSFDIPPYAMSEAPRLAVKRMRIPDTNNWIELYVYDCPGLPSLLPMTKAVIAECAYLVLVFDPHNGFSGLDNWIEQFKEATMTSKIKGVLVCNSSDDSIISDSEAEAWAKDREMLYVRVSTADRQNVDTPFALIAAAEYKKMQAEE